jgi:hypothetical protein
MKVSTIRPRDSGVLMAQHEGRKHRAGETSAVWDINTMRRLARDILELTEHRADGTVARKGHADCECYYDCRADSHTGRWHQHEDDPCPVHPDVEVVG